MDDISKTDNSVNRRYYEIPYAGLLERLSNSEAIVELLSHGITSCDCVFCRLQLSGGVNSIAELTNEVNEREKQVIDLIPQELL